MSEMGWYHVDPDDLVMSDTVRCGTLPAEVLGWVWRPRLREFVIDVRFTDAAPEFYRGGLTQIACPVGEQVLAWRPNGLLRTEQPEDQCTIDS